MKENFTSINVVIDESGSMASLAGDTIGGFNGFIADQKKVPGDVVCTLCTFNTTSKLVYDFQKLDLVQELTNKSYRPGGGTALLDALGTTITSVGKKLEALSEDERPSKVIFLIITDGQENYSCEFTKAQIKSMIETQQNSYNWEFVFMGANIDAIGEGTSLGIATRNTFNYTADAAGTKRLYKSVSDNTIKYRASKTAKVDFFNQEDEKKK